MIYCGASRLPPMLLPLCCTDSGRPTAQTEMAVFNKLQNAQIFGVKLQKKISESIAHTPHKQNSRHHPNILELPDFPLCETVSTVSSDPVCMLQYNTLQNSLALMPDCQSVPMSLLHG